MIELSIENTKESTHEVTQNHYISVLENVVKICINYDSNINIK